MMRRSRALVVVAVAFLCVSPLLYAQTSTGKIVGVVQDSSGGVLPGVSLVVRNLGTSATRDTVTDDRGQFDVSGLAPGRYQVDAEIQGFRKFSQGPSPSR